MAFQFQSTAAVGPLPVADLGLTYAQLGTLIGLYLLPGVYALSYAGMGLVPVVGGLLVDRSGGAAALWLAASL